MKLLSFVAASVFAVSAVAGNIDSSYGPVKQISLNEMKEVTGANIQSLNLSLIHI